MSKASSASKKPGHQSPAGPAPSAAPDAASMDSSRRKPSTRSKPHGKGLLRRRSTKRAEPSGVHVEKGGSLAGRPEAGAKGKEKEKELGGQLQMQQPPPPPPPQQQTSLPVKSIIPDPLSELPAWYSSDVDWAVTSAAQFRAKYPVHNGRFGPRYYRNHHLLPPRETRPPSIFSPTFPPMASDFAQDSPKTAGPSRTPSGSPLPTPNSSQVRLHDGKGRPRKLSQNAHDNASVLDGMDPWGSNLHDKSPYDLGSYDRLSPDSSEYSPVVPAPGPVRQRRASLTTPQRHKTTVPSPLSQSTSAVHLASEPLAAHLPRRLSKSRKSFRGLFGHGAEPTYYGSHSAPAAPGDYSSNHLGRKVSRTGSLIPPSIASSSTSLAPTEKRKHGSILGRLARRFSVMRKSNTSPSLHDSTRSARQSLSADAGSYPPPSQPLQEVKSLEIPRRVRPTSIGGDNATRMHHDPPPQETNHAQLVVPLDPALSLGTLHVTNPDEPPHPSIQVNSSISEQLDDEADNTGSETTQNAAIELPHNSPSSMGSPEYRHVPHTALSVISEGETYLSTPRSKPLTMIDGSPVSLPTIPSILSQATRVVPPDILVSPSSPPLPELPPPTPVSKGDYSLPPTPATTISFLPLTPTPTAKEVSLPSTTTTPTLQQTAPAHNIERINGSSPYAEEELDVLPPDMYSPLSRRVYDESDPLARASMFVNPPTPYTQSIIIPPSTASSVLPLSPQTDVSEGIPPRDASPKKDNSQRTRSRHTETFKLVRSNSGDVPTAGQGFIVGGEHWEVVESPVDRSPSKKTKKTDRTDGKKRESSSDDSDAQRKRSLRRKSVSANDRQTNEHEASQRIARARSTDAPRRSDTPERRSSTKHRHSVEGSRATQTPVIYGPRTMATYPPTEHTGYASIVAEPRTSTLASTRPTSEYQPTADPNALKAKEAWDMERLWKGRSAVYGSENVSAPTLRPHIGSDSRPSTMHRASTIPSVGDSTSTLSHTHGTNHTYFVVQTPHQAPHTYSHSPIYASSSVQGQYTSTSGHSPPSVHGRSFSDSIPFPGVAKLPELPAPQVNPLPELPRMSSYKPPPLPASITALGSGTPA